MADLCCEYNIASIVINDDTAGADRLILGPDGVTGLDGAPVRSQVDPKGVTEGGIVFTKFLGPRIIVFKGFCQVQSVEPAMNDPYFSALNALESGVVSALEGILNSASNLTWTPTGGSGKSISVTYGVPGQEIQFGGTMLEKTFQFGLIAADPTIS